MLSESVEPKVIEFVIDRIDNRQYDPISKIEKFVKEKDEAKERDFVKEIVEKERKFNKLMGIESTEVESESTVLDQSVVGVRISPKVDISASDQSKNGQHRQVTTSKKTSIRDSIDESLSQASTINKSMNSASVSKNMKKDREAELQKKAEAFFIDSKVPKAPERRNKSPMVIGKEKDLRHRIKGDKMALKMSLDGSQYSDYKGQDNGFLIEDPKKKLTAEQMMENAFNAYMSEREQYDGKFNPTEDDQDRQNYAEYKKLFDVPKDAEAFEKYRKKAEQDKIKENQEKLWKRPEPEIDEPVPCIAFDHLRPLDNPEQFIKEFDQLMESRPALPRL